MSFQAFATGFFNTINETAGRREQEADDYFNRQMQRAQTIGMNSLAQRRERRNQIESVALQLRQNASVPEDVVRALINEGPEALQGAMRIYQESAQRGVPLSEEYWRQVYNTVSDMAIDTSTPLSEFINQVAGLYPNNLEATMQTGGDPFSALVSSALGLNAMGRARSRLQGEQMGSGFSAADVLAIEARPQHERVFNVTGVGPNLEAVFEAQREVGSMLTVPQIRTFTEQFNRSVEEEVAAEERREIVERRTVNDEQREAIRRRVRSRFGEQFVVDSGLSARQLQQLPVVWNSLPQATRDAILGVTGSTLEEDSEGMAPRTATNDAPTNIFDQGFEFELVGTTSDDRLIYRTRDGRREMILTSSQARLAPTAPQVQERPVPQQPNSGGLTTERIQQGAGSLLRNISPIFLPQTMPRGQ